MNWFKIYTLALLKNVLEEFHHVYLTDLLLQQEACVVHFSITRSSGLICTGKQQRPQQQFSWKVSSVFLNSKYCCIVWCSDAGLHLNSHVGLTLITPTLEILAEQVFHKTVDYGISRSHQTLTEPLTCDNKNTT